MRGQARGRSCQVCMLESGTKASARTRVAISKSPGTFSVIIEEMVRKSLVETIIERLNKDMGLPRGGVCECMVRSFRSCTWYNWRPLKVFAFTQRKRRIEDRQSLAPNCWIERLQFNFGSTDPRVSPRVPRFLRCLTRAVSHTTSPLHWNLHRPIL